MCRMVTLNRPRICLRQQITLTTQMTGNCSTMKTTFSLTLDVKWWENHHWLLLGRTCGKNNWRKESSKNNKTRANRKLTVKKKCQSKFMRMMGNPEISKTLENNWLILAQFQRNFFKCTINVKSKIITIYNSKSQTSNNSWTMNSLTSQT